MRCWPMTGTLHLLLSLLIGLALAIVVARLAISLVPVRVILRQRSTIAVYQCTGALAGQLLGLGLFTLVVSAGGSSFEVIGGIIGYGTILSAPLSGVGACVANRVVTGAYSARQIVLACGSASLFVVAFFGVAMLFALDNIGWMVPYALSPVIGAVVGARANHLSMLGSRHKSR
jgi:hypothetical protein